MHTKKIIACLAAAAIYACGPVKNNKATITADITDLKDTVVYLSTPVADSAKTDTIAVKDGKFTWTGEISEPVKVYLMFPTRYVELFAENADITITGHADSLTDLKISGSATHDEYVAFQASLKHITDQERQLYGKYQEAQKNDTAKAAWEEQIAELRNQRRAETMQYIATHPKSPVSVARLADMAIMGEYKQLDSLYKLLDVSAQQTGTGKRLGDRIAILKKSAIGEPMIDFSQPDVNGKPVKLSDFKGKYVLLDFWASWCGPCRAENPNVLKAYNNYKDKNFTVVGVSLDDDGEKWHKAIEEDGMPWIQLSDLKGFRNEVAKQYGIQAIPSTFLLDPQGIIIAKDLRGEALHKKLAELLN
ncbi:TlpA disulfide reductase family protein [Chitinophaga cymbidii]|uniref:Thiol:disulfide interchange protein n=1 Tax=Chitinophaga cymbidii TaxID=1096750 RepID=A0A512RKR6_9BACT|nr:TlpA disulfide reductase family protein [Chitinophaga cymbidii]GEP96293.1 thiol:disulfide interchange protein [Chitinophaga cymbidii]